MPPETSLIPAGSDTVLYDSANVREEGARQHGARARHNSRPPPVKYPSLGLIVKYGSMVSVAEAQCLVMIRKCLPSVPVPEVYGWQKDGREGFIYMELVEGRTLEECWDDLAEDNKLAVCSELHDHVATWRHLPQALFSDTLFVGSVVGEALFDWVFVNTGSVGHGPFSCIADFHDWFTTAYGPNRLPPWKAQSPHPYRNYLPDSLPTVFTHADTHPSNIIVTPQQTEGRSRIAASIDWQQAGWYPDYWEYCKSRWAWSSKAGRSWAEHYLPMILDAGLYEGCYDYWDCFVAARGI